VEGGADSGEALHILGEELFAGALTRERYRSERSRRAFILVRLGEATPGLATSRHEEPPWHPALEALHTATGGVSMGGWIAKGSVLGVIIPDVPAEAVAQTCGRLEAQLRQELGATASLRAQPYPTRHGWEGAPEPAPPASPPRSAWYHASKRAMDVAVSLILLLALSPLLLLVALLVKLTSRGPILYRQPRIGYMARPFTMLKFRTMCAGADPRIHQEFVSSFIKGNAPASGPGSNALFKLTDDPRITPAGRLLRSTSLDELPQLWNVLRGDMSLVGPRPPLRYEYDQYEPWHHRRLLEAQPGITGLWQVAGRSRTTFDDMVRLDLRYAKTRSIWTDVKILLATPAAVISGRGAC
jgi:lipopolysaccharide/colanic/teichoic acid biosynthesis glycosyltransferase